MTSSDRTQAGNIVDDEKQEERERQEVSYFKRIQISEETVGDNDEQVRLFHRSEYLSPIPSAPASASPAQENGNTPHRQNNRRTKYYNCRYIGFLWNALLHRDKQHSTRGVGPWRS